MEKDTAYESPTIRTVGSIHEVTKAADSPNGDAPVFPIDNAFPPGS